jgi:hypothetical protein
VPGTIYTNVGVHKIVDGIAYDLYHRTCNNDIGQSVWVPDLPAQDVAQSAYDIIRGRIDTPQPLIFPGAENNTVNAPTRFGATPQPAQTATATIPGLTVTITATPTLLTLDTGSTVNGDTTHIECTPWGHATPTDTDSCRWTPTWPSVRATTGTDDHHYHATISVTWHITWTATNATTGTLDDITTAAPINLAVREIQTVGGA